MADGNILSDFGINILEEEIDDVIFQTNEFLTDATFTGSQGPFWWILQMCMALAALFAIVMAAGMAYKMMVKHEPLDVMKLFRPLAVSIILCWFEQKAVCVLMALLALGIRGIRLGPTLPAFLSPGVAAVLQEKYDLRPITTPEDDLAACLGGS